MDGRISNFAQIAYARRYTLTEGRESGLKVIEVNNGKLRFLLNESKALDVMQLWHDNINVAFVCKNGFCADDRSFENRFEGGMLYTCGIENIGARAGLLTHGSLHNIPAKITNVKCDTEQITVEGEMRFSALFGQNLLLKRKIVTKIGSDTLTLTDSLINQGYGDENYCMLYHFNLGYPMLNDGATVQIDASEVVPRTDWARQNLKTAFTMQKSIPLEEECCYFIKVNKPEVSVVNPLLNKTLTLKYSNDTLPEFIEWKSMASGDYALGLEPATSTLDGDFKYKTIAPNQNIDFKLELTIKNN